LKLTNTLSTAAKNFGSFTSVINILNFYLLRFKIQYNEGIAMKMRFLLASVIFFGTSSIAMAQPGCGVGAMIWKGQSGIVPHALAATTNPIASQTVSITLGIAGCSTNERVQSMAMLIEARGSVIAADISRGEGENLIAMAAALNIPKNERPAFYSLLHKNFLIIFPSSDVNSGGTVSAIVALLEKDAALSKYVAA
jgi:hypothetical protein